MTRQRCIDCKKCVEIYPDGYHCDFTSTVFIKLTNSKAVQYNNCKRFESKETKEISAPSESNLSWEDRGCF